MKIPSLKRGITAKLFWITSGLMIVTTLVIYLATYFLLPRYYYVYKRNHLQSEVQQLVLQVNGLDATHAGDVLDQFALQNNLRIVVTNNQGAVVYPGVPTAKAIWIQSGNSRVLLSPGGQNTGKVVSVNAFGAAGALTVSHELTLAGMPALRLIVVAPLQPITEASHVLLLFLPYMFLIALVISITGSSIYSIVVARPLLKLNRVARQMANLDFTDVPALTRKDEIGELSVSLNGLAVNLQQTLQQLKDDIEREREEEVKRREFVAIISHELKSPLTAVLGQLEAMIARIGVYRDRDKYLRQSYGLMKTMEKLVYEILDVSKMDRAAFTPTMERIDIKDLLKRVLEDNAYFADEKGIRIQKTLEYVSGVLADANLLKRAIHNVFLNAIQYSPAGEEIRVNLVGRGESFSLRIENTGVHIDAGLLDKVFDPFYRIEQSRSRQTGGSGLGLYIVKRALEVQGIPYQFENTDDGVCFTMILKQA